MFFFLQPECTSTNDGLWLGATDTTTEGTFIWENSGKPLTYNKWADKEPNDQGLNEDCTHMWCFFEDSQWNDWPCDYNGKPQTTLCEVIFQCV